MSPRLEAAEQAQVSLESKRGRMPEPVRSSEEKVFRGMRAGHGAGLSRVRAGMPEVPGG